jgi:hypothetical protein
MKPGGIKFESDSVVFRKRAQEHAELVEARRHYRESGVLKSGFEVESSGTVVHTRTSMTANLKSRNSIRKVIWNWSSVQTPLFTFHCIPVVRYSRAHDVGRLPSLARSMNW